MDARDGGSVARWNGKIFLPRTRSTLVLFLSAMCLFRASVLSAQAAPALTAMQSRILTLENAWNQAVQQQDGAALQMLLAPDLIYIERDGSLMTKAQYISVVQDSTLHPNRIASESMDVHIYGPAAVVTGVYIETGSKNGKPYSIRDRFTDTWILRNNSWECVASQSTTIPR
jgi:ketosteroid isomerase-like protein